VTIRYRNLFFVVAPALLLSACDLSFLDEEAKIEAKKQAEGMAVGSGCRYSSRPLEDCYSMNPKMSKAAILNGWREMDAYMRENNIVSATPPGEAAAPAKKAEEAADAEAPAAEPAKAAEAPPEAAAPEAAKTPAPNRGAAKQPKHVV
jgi:hypothetical protein